MTDFTITDYVDEGRQVVTEIYHGDADRTVVLVGHTAMLVAVEAGARRRMGDAVHQAFLAGVYLASAKDEEGDVDATA